MLSPTQWLLVTVAALCIGLAKSGFGGIGFVSVLIMAQVLPAKESTGAILPMLIVADIFAVIAYRKHTIWSHLFRLMIPTAVGIVSGWLLMPHIPDQHFGHFLGWVTLALMILVLVQKSFPRILTFAVEHPGFAWPIGWLTGFTTMLANAAGPVMTLYLLAARLPKYEFVGTAAWFFFIINVAKIPFSWSLGLIHPSSLTMNLILIPAIVGGIFTGRWLLGKINQQAFEWLMIGFTFLGALRLILRG